MQIAVVGASGLIGAPLSEALQGQGHEVRRLHRSSTTYPVDLRTGAGLAAALAGVDVIVNAANQSPPRGSGPVMIEGTRRLLAASSAHHVLVSVVGLEAMAPLSGYYRTKLTQEGLLRQSGRPFSIVRSTQFHEFLGGFALRLARYKVELHSRGQVQPIAARDAAAVLARTSTEPPQGATVTVAGPETLTVTQLRAGRGVWVPLPVGRRIATALERGALTLGAPDIRGVLSYAQWLAEAQGRPWRPLPR